MGKQPLSEVLITSRSRGEKWVKSGALQLEGNSICEENHTVEDNVAGEQEWGRTLKRMDSSAVRPRGS